MQPRPTDKICSVSSDSSSSPDATKVVRTIRGNRSLVTVDPSVWVVRPRQNAASIEEVDTFGLRPDGRKRNSPLPSFRV